MVQKAVRLTKDDEGDGNIDQYGLGVEPSIIRLTPFVWSNGGELVDDEENPTRLTLDTPAAQEAMQAFFDLRDKHLVMSRVRSSTRAQSPRTRVSSSTRST